MIFGDGGSNGAISSWMKSKMAAILKISNGHISATHYPLHFMYVHRPCTLPSDAVKTIDGYEIGHLFSEGG